MSTRPVIVFFLALVMTACIVIVASQYNALVLDLSSNLGSLDTLLLISSVALFVCLVDLVAHSMKRRNERGGAATENKRG